jgi:hypothetical protein
LVRRDTVFLAGDTVYVVTKDTVLLVGGDTLVIARKDTVGVSAGEGGSIAVRQRCEAAWLIARKEDVN